MLTAPLLRLRVLEPSSVDFARRHFIGDIPASTRVFRILSESCRIPNEFTHLYNPKQFTSHNPEADVTANEGEGFSFRKMAGGQAGNILPRSEDGYLCGHTKGGRNRNPGYRTEQRWKFLWTARTASKHI